MESVNRFLCGVSMSPAELNSLSTGADEGDITDGIEHLSNALVVSPQPKKLMEIFEKNLRPVVCCLVTSQISAAHKRIFGSEPESTGIWKDLDSSREYMSPILKLIVKEFDSSQQFLIQELVLGNKYLAKGDVSNGAKHISNLMKVCFDPQKLMQALQNSLSCEIYKLLTEEMIRSEHESTVNGKKPFPNDPEAELNFFANGDSFESGYLSNEMGDITNCIEHLPCTGTLFSTTTNRGLSAKRASQCLSASDFSSHTMTQPESTGIWKAKEIQSSKNERALLNEYYRKFLIIESSLSKKA